MLLWDQMMSFFNSLNTNSQLDRCYLNETRCWNSLKGLSQNGIENIIAEQDIIGFVSMGSNLQDCNARFVLLKLLHIPNDKRPSVCGCAGWTFGYNVLT